MISSETLKVYAVNVVLNGFRRGHSREKAAGSCSW